MSTEPTATPEKIDAVKASLARIEANDTDKKAEKKVTPKKVAVPHYIEFVSKEPEMYEFELLDIRPSRRPDRRLVWLVPGDIVARFEVHHHVQRGRIVRADAQI